MQRRFSEKLVSLNQRRFNVSVKKSPQFFFSENFVTCVGEIRRYLPEVVVVVVVPPVVHLVSELGTVTFSLTKLYLGIIWMRVW